MKQILTLFGVLTLLSLVFMLAGGPPVEPGSPAAVDATTRSGPRVVRYRVSGSAITASVTYRNATGGTEQRDSVRLPWTYDLGQVQPGQFLYISAQVGTSLGGTVETDIVEDDVTLKRSVSEGAYTIATASMLYDKR